MVEASSLLAALRQRLPRMVGDTGALVNIESGSYDAAGVSRVVHWVGERLATLGFVTTCEPVAERGDRLTAIRQSSGRGRLMILGHADTVWPAGTLDDWHFARVGDRYTGPGVGDMKGGVVMALHALELLLERDAAPFAAIRFLLVPDEELGSPQSRAWIEENARQSDWILVVEPTRPGGGLVTSRGAVGAFFVEARGISAHAAVNYEKGASAIRELARMVAPLERLAAPQDGMIVNVGTFQGGAARQVIPHWARIAIDLRAREAQQVAMLDRALAGIVADKQDPRVELELSGQWTRPLFPRLPGSVELYGRAERIARSLGLPCFEMPTASGGSDGSFCGALGVATLDGLGPICFDTCSREETIPADSLAERGAVFAGLVADLAGRLSH